MAIDDAKRKELENAKFRRQRLRALGVKAGKSWAHWRTHEALAGVRQLKLNDGDYFMPRIVNTMNDSRVLRRQDVYEAILTLKHAGMRDDDWDAHCEILETSRDFATGFVFGVRDWGVTGESEEVADLGIGDLVAGLRDRLAKVMSRKVPELNYVLCYGDDDHRFIEVDPKTEDPSITGFERATFFCDREAAVAYAKKLRHLDDDNSAQPPLTRPIVASDAQQGAIVLIERAIKRAEQRRRPEHGDET